MILITGGAGYIGSHSAIKFLEDNREVVIFDNLETGHIETVETLKTIGRVEFVKGDLRNIDEIRSVFEKYKIDAVIHFAANALVGESVTNPAKYYRNNTFGTLNLLDCMIEHDVKKIVFSSTCATYGEPKYTPIDENHPQNPINPYGMSKLGVEKIMADYDRADNKARIGEWHDIETHLIPNILKSTFDKNKKFKIFGNDYDTPDGTCIRDYVNIEDLADAHRLALLYLEKENKSDVFNLGTQQGDSVKNVFDTCERVLGAKIDVEVVERREGDPKELYANSKKAKEILGWSPKRTLEDSIKTAYEWEKKLNKDVLNV